MVRVDDNAVVDVRNAIAVLGDLTGQILGHAVIDLSIEDRLVAVRDRKCRETSLKWATAAGRSAETGISKIRWSDRVDADQVQRAAARDHFHMNGPAIGAVVTPRKNLLLAALSAEARERIFPHLELMSLRLGQFVKEPGRSPHHVYFPVNCVVSLLCALESGAVAEIALVGNQA